MNRLRLFLLLLALVLLGSALAPPAGAQNTISATVDRTQLTTDDGISLTVTIDGQPDGPPVLPPIDGLRVAGTASQTSVSIINGVTTAQSIYRYRLLPTRIGAVRIDPISVSFSGVVVQTAPIAIDITQGSQPVATPPPQTIVPPTELNGQEFYVDATVDRATPYIGQQVRYIFRFYQAVELDGRPTYSPPNFRGFWNTQQNEQTQTLTDVNGRTYRVTSLINPIFATLAGPRTIEPARFNLPDGRVLLTQPVTLTVRALPEPVPADFSGAVGRYTLAAQVERPTVTVGEPVQLRVTLSGIGNIDTLPQPDWPTLAGWRAFEARSTADSEFSNGILRGSRTYLRLLTPTVAGNFTLPPISYTFFDPDSGENGAYETVVTEPIALTVTGSSEPALNPSAETTVLAVDLRPLQRPATLDRRLPGSAPGAAIWLLWLVPPALLVGARWWRSYRARAAAGPTMTPEAAQRAAQRALSAARRGGSRAVESADRILSNYLHDRFGLVVAALTLDQLSNELHARGTAPPVVQSVAAIYAQTHASRFGQAPADGSALIDAVAAVIEQLDQVGQVGQVE